MTAPSALSRFRAEYGAYRASEGRGHEAAELQRLPYLDSGPFAKQWSVRARTFDSFLAKVLVPAVRAPSRRPRLLDLGAGNGWLCWRATHAGSAAVAVDVRDDDIDGLGAAAGYFVGGKLAFDRIVGAFDSLPLPPAQFDIVVFNAALHYATDLVAALAEARRVLRPGGRLAILDSPFYERDADGEAMVAEKRARAAEQFGDRVEALMGIPFIEYLTADRLTAASAGLDLAWRRHRVSYPLWYEIRPFMARLLGRRAPSRFDLWVGMSA